MKSFWSGYSSGRKRRFFSCFAAIIRLCFLSDAAYSATQERPRIWCRRYSFASRENTFDASKGSARTWLVQMVYRRAFDRRAYLHRRQFYHGTDEAACANAVSGAKSLETDVVERLTAQQLRAAFCELSENQKETLELFFFEGLKLVEIAERTGEDIKNVRHHYYRGLERLRQLARELTRDEGGHDGGRKGEEG